MRTLVSDSHHTTYNKIDIVEKSPHRMGNVLVRHRHRTYTAPYPHILHILYKNGRLKVHASMLTIVNDSHHTTYNKIDIVEKSPHMLGNLLARLRQHRYSSSYKHIVHLLGMKVLMCMRTFVFDIYNLILKKFAIMEKSRQMIDKLLVCYSLITHRYQCNYGYPLVGASDSQEVSLYMCTIGKYGLL